MGARRWMVLFKNIVLLLILYSTTWLHKSYPIVRGLRARMGRAYSGGVIGSEESMRMLVLSACTGAFGTGGNRGHARAITVHRKLGVVGWHVLSRAAPPDIAVPRVVICRVDTEVACNEVRPHNAGDIAGVVDNFVLTALPGLFGTLFGTDVVLARGLMQDVVMLFAFVSVSDISMQRVDPDKVRLHPELSGTNRAVDDDGFDRREMREGSFLIEVVGDGVGVVRLSTVWLLVLTVSLVASEPARRKSATEHLGNISTCVSATEILRLACGEHLLGNHE